MGDPYDTLIVIKDEVVGDYRRAIHQRDYETPGAYHRWYILIGPRGAVQFAYMTSPVLQETMGDLGEEYSILVGDKMGMDVGYHSYEPMWEGHDPMEDCDLLIGQDHCYYDGSGLQANRWVHAWASVDFGEWWVWEALRVEYESVFGGADDIG